MSVKLCAIAFWTALALAGSLALSQQSCDVRQLSLIGNRRMPSTVGCAFSVVQQVFTQHNVTATQKVIASDVPKGQITAQDRPFMAAVQPNSTVVLTVSGGPQAAPNIFNKFNFGKVAGNGGSPAGAAVAPNATGVKVAAAADLGVANTTVAGVPYHPGDAVTLSFRVHNFGPGLAQQVTISPQAVQGLQIQRVTGRCSSLQCTLPLLRPNEDADVSVNASITGAGRFGFSVSVSSLVADPNNNNNQVPVWGMSYPVQAPSGADVQVTSTSPTITGRHPGDQVTLSFAVQNGGPGGTRASVSPSVTNFQISKVSGACAGLPCMVPLLKPNDRADFTVAGTILNEGYFRVVLSAVGTAQDPNPGNNQAYAEGTATTIVAQGRPYLTVSGTISPGPYSPGQTVTSTITVTNTGTGAASGFRLIEDRNNLTPAGIVGAGCTSLPCLVSGTLPAGGQTTFWIKDRVASAGDFTSRVTVPADIPGQRDKSVSLTGTAGSGAAGPGPAGPPTAPDASADLALSGSIEQAAPYAVGQVLTLGYDVANHGPLPAAGIVMQQDSIEGLRIGSIDGCSGFPCSLATIAPGGSLHFSVTATTLGEGPFQQVLSVSPAVRFTLSGNIMPLSGGGEAPPPGRADLVLTAEPVPVTPHKVGEVVDVKLTLENRGTATARGIRIEQTTSGHLALVGVMGGCATMPCNPKSLGPGAAATMTVRERITEAGAFHGEFRVTDPIAETDLENNVAGFQGRTTDGPGWWLWAAGLTVAVGGVGGTALASHLAKKTHEKWRAQTQVSASVDTEAAVSRVPVGLPFKLPPVSVSAHLVLGTAEPDGPVKIDREVVEHD